MFTSFAFLFRKKKCVKEESSYSKISSRLLAYTYTFVHTHTPTYTPTRVKNREETDRFPAKAQKTENSNIHGFEVYRPSSKGTKLLLQVIKAIVNQSTIPERYGEVRDFNVTLLVSAIARRRHLVIDMHRTNLGVTRQGCHYIHEMIVTVNRTCVLLASEDMITQRIDAHLAGAKRPAPILPCLSEPSPAVTWP